MAEQNYRESSGDLMNLGGNCRSSLIRLMVALLASVIAFAPSAVLPPSGYGQECTAPTPPLRQIPLTLERGNEICPNTPGHMFWFDAQQGQKITVSVTKKDPTVWLARCEEWSADSCTRHASDGIFCDREECFNGRRVELGELTRLEPHRVDPNRTLGVLQLLYSVPTTGRYIVYVEAQDPSVMAEYTLKINAAWCYYEQRVLFEKCPY